MWRLREATLSPFTAQYAEALFRVAQLYERRNMLDDSDTVCKEVLRLRHAFFGWESLAIAEVLLLIALLRARAMLLDESELLLKEVLRIAQMFSGNGGVEVHGAVALFAHIYMIRGNIDLAMKLHMEAFELQVFLCDPPNPMQPLSGNLAKVWMLNSEQCGSDASGAMASAPVAQSVREASPTRNIWTNSGVGGTESDPLHAILFSLPEGCAPEVLANWVVHSDLLEAKGYAKRRVYEPENHMAAAWAAAGVDNQELEPVSEDVIDFFLDREQLAQIHSAAQEPGNKTDESQQALSPPDDSQPQQSESAPPTWTQNVSEGTVPQSMYEDCVSTGGSKFINLYANVSEHLPMDTLAPLQQVPAPLPMDALALLQQVPMDALALLQQVPEVPAVREGGVHVRSIGGGGGQ